MSQTVSSQRYVPNFQVLDREYSTGPVVRADADLFPSTRRGSIRLVLDLYRTEPELDQLVAEGMQLKLPGDQGYKPQSSLLQAIKQMVRC
jgi:hypothetical protein